MTRTEFTFNIAKLIFFAQSNGFDLVGGWWLRDEETQKRMFNDGKTLCTSKRKGY
jgi:hypothetical protein